MRVSSLQEVNGVCVSFGASCLRMRITLVLTSTGKYGLEFVSTGAQCGFFHKHRCKQQIFIVKLTSLRECVIYAYTNNTTANIEV